MCGITHIRLFALLDLIEVESPAYSQKNINKINDDSSVLYLCLVIGAICYSAHSFVKFGWKSTRQNGDEIGAHYLILAILWSFYYFALAIRMVIFNAEPLAKFPWKCNTAKNPIISNLLFTLCKLRLLDIMLALLNPIILFWLGWACLLDWDEIWFDYFEKLKSKLLNNNNKVEYTSI
ncbi:unnamed protein product [Rhizophagus irregularis]|nr:unnamed protein product [Rhizophagus irregularis]CAB5384689.1 unnamed protein product [Rhizophagus irregularis]